MSVKPGMTAAFLVSVTFASLQAQAQSPQRVESPPNVVLIYADDLGFGDAIHHTGMSDTLASRKGDWVLINGPTGDNGRQEPEWIRQERGVEPHSQPVELFNLETDRQQTKNLAAEHPEKVEELKKLLSQLEESGRTRPDTIRPRLHPGTLTIRNPGMWTS